MVEEAFYNILNAIQMYIIVSLLTLSLSGSIEIIKGNMAINLKNKMQSASFIFKIRNCEKV